MAPDGQQICHLGFEPLALPLARPCCLKRLLLCQLRLSQTPLQLAGTQSGCALARLTCVCLMQQVGVEARILRGQAAHLPTQHIHLERGEVAEGGRTGGRLVGGGA